MPVSDLFRDTGMGTKEKIKIILAMYCLCGAWSGSFLLPSYLGFVLVNVPEIFKETLQTIYYNYM